MLGIHTNFRGVWRLNASNRHLVSIEIDPPATGHVCKLPIKPRRIVVNLDAPEGFLAAVLG